MTVYAQDIFLGVFCYGDEENARIYAVHLTTANQSEIRRAYLVSVSEEGNQATAQLSFGFTRAYNEKIRKHGVRLMRSGRIFEYERGRKPCNKILFIKKHFIWLSQ